MDLIFPNDGLVQQLHWILTTGVHYHLYTNNVIPGLSDTTATYTEAIWTGYAAVFQDWSNFTLNGVSANSGYAIAPPISFTNSSGSSQNTYGYYVTDVANGILLAAARFDSPPITILDGQGVAVVPTWGDLSQLSS